MFRNFKILFFIFILVVSSASTLPKKNSEAKTKQQLWVDSVFDSMSEEERLGQLFMVAAYSNRDEKHSEELEKLIREYNIGGLIFFQGGPVRQAILTNRYQAKAKVPLLIAIDGEWGLKMRLDSSMAFPKQMTLGAVQDDAYIYAMGKEVARQCKRLGIHVNFAPVIDVNSNPANPVIGVRSFGEDKFKVAEKGIAYMKGMQDNGVIACAKHFPGHGDTETDSHLTLPVITHTKERLNDVELYPFRELIKDSVFSIMVAHMHVPAYDSTTNMATTLSKSVVTDLLKNELQFKGLIFTDALNMKGVSSFFKPGEVDVLALLAGNDVLLYAEDVPTAIRKIHKAIKENKITWAEVDERVKKILTAKFWAGLDSLKPIELHNLYEDLNSSEAKALRQDIYEKALTIVRNDDNLIPIRILDTTTFASITIGVPSQGSNFQHTLDLYAPFTHFTLHKNAGEAETSELEEKLKNYGMVVIGLEGVSSFNIKDYGISLATIDFIERLQQNTKTALIVFGNPYSLKFFNNSNTLICAYEDNEVTTSIAPQLLFGALGAYGKLPVTVDPSTTQGAGILMNKSLQRLSFGYPESVCMDSKTLSQIDTIALKAIEAGAMPGCQVLVAKNGKVIYRKSFGYLTYDKTDPVTDTTIYDIASISKVAGTLQVIMFLSERGLLNLDKKASYYLPELKRTNKEDLQIRDILTHQAGLLGFLSHWKRTTDSAGFSPTFYSTIKSDVYCNEVIPSLYSIASMEDSLWKWSIESELREKPRNKKKYDYLYSDIGFYIMKRIVEKLINQPMDEFLDQNFYVPLGLTSLSYKPLNHFPIERIAPTENDKDYRHVIVRGHVHDPGAAMFGGVGGHAGIFSNSLDLAILFQMNLQRGTYGGIRYLLPETIPLFAKKQFEDNRRGLGWDKPAKEPGGPTSNYASQETFGHTGFTGTAAWADPQSDLVYVFLSNRVYPDAANTKLVKMGVRTNIQDVIYKSILNYNPTE